MSVGAFLIGVGRIAYCGWYHPSTGELVSSIPPWHLLHVPVLSSCPGFSQREAITCKTKQILSSPSWFWPWFLSSQQKASQNTKQIENTSLCLGHTGSCENAVRKEGKTEQASLWRRSQTSKRVRRSPSQPLGQCQLKPQWNSTPCFPGQPKHGDNIRCRQGVRLSTVLSHLRWCQVVESLWRYWHSGFL